MFDSVHNIVLCIVILLGLVVNGIKPKYDPEGQTLHNKIDCNLIIVIIFMSQCFVILDYKSK